MSCAEFHEHWAEYLASPWGEERADLRSGIVAAILYNANRGSDQPAKSAADFMSYREGDSEDEVAARAKFAARQRRR